MNMFLKVWLGGWWLIWLATTVYLVVTFPVGLVLAGPAGFILGCLTYLTWTWNDFVSAQERRR